ncbi:MAG: hypothetical protein NVSMB18_15960 [Acetobacteraceae bacterium]
MLAGTAPMSIPDLRPSPRADHDRRLHSELRRALARDELTTVYQPRVDLATGKILACEALLRWPGRVRGVLPPSVFIPVAERSDLINDIGGWVLTQACSEARLWGGCRISVNVSGRQLAAGVLLDQVSEALERSGLDPDRLELELTESQLIDCSLETLLTLSAIRDLGVGVALDDFGTGWASLAMLKRLPLTTMKLDRSLARGLPSSREDAAIARGIIQMGQALGLAVVAEGIETEAQRSYLVNLGCDEGQGYLFGAGVPGELIWPLVAQHHVACPGGRSAPASAYDRSAGDLTH